jgi:hypothetical protein
MPLPVSGRRAIRTPQASAAAFFRSGGSASFDTNGAGRSLADGLLAVWHERNPLDVTRLARTAITSMTLGGRADAAKPRPGFPGVLQRMQGSSGRGMILRKSGWARFIFFSSLL